MDAKSKANFINAIASGQEIPCPTCGTLNKSDSKNCVSCGKDLSAPVAMSDAPAFAPAVDSVAEVQSTSVKDEVPLSAFAQGLPDWSIEPPQVMVRRR